LLPAGCWLAAGRLAAARQQNMMRTAAWASMHCNKLRTAAGRLLACWPLRAIKASCVLLPAASALIRTCYGCQVTFYDDSNALLELCVLALSSSQAQLGADPVDPLVFTLQCRRHDLLAHANAWHFSTPAG
jgi:hypothetical protein